MNKRLGFIFLIISLLATIVLIAYIFFSLEKPVSTVTKETESEVKTVTITAVGDCTFATDIGFSGGTSFDKEYENQNKDHTYFLRNVLPLFEKDDLTIVNFEGTLSERGTRAEKEYSFRGNPEYVKILTSSSVEAANLANNHTRDYGEEALFDTQQILEENGVLWFGRNHSVLKYANGAMVGLIGTPAYNSSGMSAFLKELKELKSYNPDIIIASFHWGEELSTTPNEIQKQLAHTAIDNGVDLVIGHHPHILQGIEKYKGKYIVYSLGNFCFGGHKNPSDKDTILFRQTFSFKNGQLLDTDNAEVIPCSISSVNDRNNYQPTPLSDEDFERVRKKLIERSSGFSGIECIKFTE